MLIQPPRNLAPNALLQLEIPDRTQPILDSGEWGINIAAAVDLDPDRGLKIFIPPWADMNRGDAIELMLNGSVVDQARIEESDVGHRITLYIGPRRLVTGSYSLHYVVTRLNQTPEPSAPRVNIYVKLERPAGKDENGSIPGHSELHMYIDPLIINDGVGKEIADKGLDIPIIAKPGSTLLYPNIAVGDQCKLSWGGLFVYSPLVTQAHIDDPTNNPLIVHVDTDTIYKAGDTPALTVVFEVRDLVNNVSEDWSAGIQIAVDTGNTRLPAPVVKGSINNVLDLDTQGDAPVILQIFATEPDFKVGDVLIGLCRGTTLDDEPISLEVRGEPLESVNNVYELKLSSADVRLLVMTQAVFSYRVERSGSPDLLSKGRFVSLIGETRRLLAPIARDAQQGALDPELGSTIVDIPFDDETMTEGMAIVLRWVGIRADFSTYDPELDWYILSRGDIEAKLAIPIPVDGAHLRAINGGTLDLFYLLMSEVVGGGTRQRESLHHALLQVGEPRLELAPPIVLGEADGALEPNDLPGGVSRLTAPRANTPTKIGDKVTYTWLGPVTGQAKDTLSITSLNADKDIPFTLNQTFVATHIEPNRGGTVKAWYEILRVATDTTPERVSYSNVLEFIVGAVAELLPPSVKENNGDSTLNPIAVKDSLTLVVKPIPELAPADQISVTWQGAAGTPAGGSHTSTPRPVSAGWEFVIPNSVVAFNLGKGVKLSYVVTRNGNPMPSPVFALTVQAMPTSALIRPVIKDADNNGEGPVLDVTSLTADAAYRLGGWPLIAIGQYVWLRFRGTNADGTDYFNEAHTAPGSYVSQQWIDNNGYYESHIALAGLKNLKDGSSLSMELKAALGKSTVESEAVVFPVRTYTIKALVEEKPEITSVKDAYGNEVANDTIIVNDAVDLTGTATAGLEVEIFDGTTSIGTSTVNASGVWTYRVQGMNVGPHRLTAKALYGSNPVSAPRTFSVAIALVPAITSVTDSKGNDIPNNGTTRDTTVNLTGTATASLEVEIFDGATSTGKRPVNANGVWTHSVQSMGGGSHSLTAKALYGSQQSSAPYAVTVITTPELIIDQEPMVLDGIKLIQNDGWLTKEVAGNVKSRTPTGGQGPFTYESSRPDIASVDGNGKVSGLKQGQAQITVKDALQNSATYSVTVSNVYRMLRNWVYREFTGHVSWIEASGGITATAARDCALAINTNFANLLTTGPFHPSLRPEVARHAVFDPTRDSTGGFPRYQGAYWDSSTGIVSTQMSPVTFWGGAFAFVPLV